MSKPDRPTPMHVYTHLPCHPPHPPGIDMFHSWLTNAHGPLCVVELNLKPPAVVAVPAAAEVHKHLHDVMYRLIGITRCVG